MTLVLHEGGPKDGKTLNVVDVLDDRDLVYGGPTSWTLYRRTSPLRTLATEDGEAEVFACILVDGHLGDVPQDYSPN